MGLLYRTVGVAGRKIHTLASGVIPAVIALLAAALLSGCAGRRNVVISALPSDALITIDGVTAGRGRVEKRLNFAGGQIHTVQVSRLGFSQQMITLNQPPEGVVEVKLEPQSKRVQIRVEPLPAIVKVDGTPVSPVAVEQFSRLLEFSVDSKGAWVPHVISAERPGFRQAQRLVRFTDAETTYTLRLETERKDVTIRTDPPGAQLFVDGKSVGEAPQTLENFVIDVDPQTNAWIGHKVRATKTGYEAADATISWDDGKSEYVLKLIPASVAVIPSPATPTTPAATTTAPTVEAPSTTAPATTVPTVPAPPVATTVPASSPATPATPPARTLALLRAHWEHGSNGWRANGKMDNLPTTAATAEPAGGPRVAQIASAPAGAVVESVASSPDGSMVVYALLRKDGDALQSRIIVHHFDGDHSEKPLTDGKSLDLGPTFAPDGLNVLFSRAAAGGGAAVFQAAADGSAEAKVLAGAEEGASDLTPSLDSAPQPHLYVESHPADGSAARLVAVSLPEGKRADLKQVGAQPRVSPSADAVVFTRRDARTGKRDLFLLREGADEPVNLTNSPDDDDFDPAWSKDGNRIAFASTRATATENPGRDANLWVMPISKPEKARQITASPAWDDSPAWDGDGMALYFRSSRGGEWGVWKVEVSR